MSPEHLNYSPHHHLEALFRVHEVAACHFGIHRLLFIMSLYYSRHKDIQICIFLNSI